MGLLQTSRVPIERVASGIIIISIVHPPADGGVVVANDGDLGQVSHDLTAGVGLRSIAYDVAEADKFVDRRVKVFIGFHHWLKSVNIGVYVTEDSDQHRDYIRGEGPAL